MLSTVQYNGDGAVRDRALINIVVQARRCERAVLNGTRKSPAYERLGCKRAAPPAARGNETSGNVAWRGFIKAADSNTITFMS